MSHLNWDPMNTVARRSGLATADWAVGGDTTQAGIAVDTDGYTDLVLTGVIGTMNTTGTITIKVQTDDNSGFSSPTDVTGATTAAIAAADDNRPFRIRVRKSQVQQYVRGFITTAAGGTGVDGVSLLWELHGPVRDELADGSPDSTLSLQSATKFDAAV